MPTIGLSELWLMTGLFWSVVGWAVAVRKNRSQLLWFLLCLVGGILALIPLLILPTLDKESRRPRVRSA